VENIEMPVCSKRRDYRYTNLPLNKLENVTSKTMKATSTATTNKTVRLSHPVC